MIKIAKLLLEGVQLKDPKNAKGAYHGMITPKHVKILDKSRLDLIEYLKTHEQDQESAWKWYRKNKQSLYRKIQRASDNDEAAWFQYNDEMAYNYLVSGDWDSDDIKYQLLHWDSDKIK